MEEYRLSVVRASPTHERCNLVNSAGTKNDNLLLCYMQVEQKDIVAAYKREGLFDAKRRQLFDEFCADTARREQLLALVERLVKCKIQKDPDVFAKNTGKLSTLIQTELVKRYALNKKLKVKRGGNSDDIGMHPSTETTEADARTLPLNTATETELMDMINDLLDSYAHDREMVSVETLSSLVPK